MPDTTPERWKRWSSGTYRLHMSTGIAIDFTGRLRTKENETFVVDYETDSESLKMPPNISEVVAIEKLPDPLS